MIATATVVALVLLSGSVLLATWRLLRGPDPADRVLALDTLYINGVALVVVAGIRLDDQAYFEAALVIALLGFAGTAALARFLVPGETGK